MSKSFAEYMKENPRGTNCSVCEQPVAGALRGCKASVCAVCTARLSWGSPTPAGAAIASEPAPRQPKARAPYVVGANRPTAAAAARLVLAAGPCHIQRLLNAARHIHHWRGSEDKMLLALAGDKAFERLGAKNWWGLRKK